MFTRSELHERQLDAFPSRTANSSTSSSSPSFISSLPTTPRRPSHTPLPSQAHNSPSSVGLLTPSSSKASLSPALSRYKGQYQPPSPAFSLDEHRKSKRAPPNRRLFFPVRASLELHTRPARSSAAYMSDEASRPGSPVRRSRAMSRARPELGARPPSRCESLLRDTLRRADEQERTMSHRNASRSPGRWAGRKTRPRGNSLFEALNREGSADSDCEFEDNVFVQPMNERDAFSYLNRAQPMAMRGRGATSASSTEVGSLPYGSPSSPSPVPPSMLRTRTSPTVPRVKGRTYDDEAPRLPPSPRTEQRRSLPHTVSQSHASIAASNDSSPKQRLNTLSPHESVLRAKLEYVLQKAGPPCVDESAVSSQLVGRVRRNHQRAFSHGVTVITSPKHRDDPFSTSPSPQSLAPSSLSNSVTDLARVHSRTSQRRDSFACRTSSSSPPEPITPPPTPPFNARTASEVCKRMDGYVSFASVEGLGEPPGIDIDGEDSEEGLRRWGRFFRMFPFVNGARGSSEHEAGQQHVVSRYRSDSATSMN